MDVTLRRRFGFERGALTAYEDEHLIDRAEADRRSAILASEIERPRTGPMRDIVATIQPEQDVVVRTDLATSVCVQGAPGTGKTAVGLHRAAWLLYAHRDRLRRSGVLVVGPNRAFLSYIGQVLPALGEVEVRQTTVDELVGHAVPIRAVDPVDVAGLKGDARMAQVLERAVWAPLRPPRETLVVTIGSRRWRVPAYVASDAVHALRQRGLRYAAGRAALPHRLAHEVLLLMEREGATTDDRVQDQVARTRPVKAYVDEVWPAIDPLRLVLRLLSDPSVLADAADGILTAEEQEKLLWHKVVRGPATAPWSVADAVLVDEAADLVDRTPSLGHVVLDEAQDLSPMQLRAVGRRCSTGSATVLGDLAQGTTPWATPSWDVALAHLGKADAIVEVLDRGYRVPAAVIDFAARLLPVMAPDLGAPVSVRDDPGRLDLVQVPAADVASAATAVGARGAGPPGVRRPHRGGRAHPRARVGTGRRRDGVPPARRGRGTRRPAGGARRHPPLARAGVDRQGPGVRLGRRRRAGGGRRRRAARPASAVRRPDPRRLRPRRGPRRAAARRPDRLSPWRSASSARSRSGPMAAPSRSGARGCVLSWYVSRWTPAGP